MLSCVFLVAAVAADYSCVVPVTGRNGQEVNLTAVPRFFDDEELMISDGSKQNSNIGVSTCKPVLLSGGCTGYAYLGLFNKCYDKPPQSFTNGTTNVTTLFFNSSSLLRSSSYLFGAAGEMQLTIAYLCDADAGNDNLRYQSGVQSQSGDITLTFATRAACPVSTAPTTAAPTSTTAPTTEAPKKDDAHH